MIDFTQYTFGEKADEEKKAFTQSKAMVFMIVSFIILFLSIAEVVTLFFIKLPHDNLWIWLSANGAVTIFNFVMLIMNKNINKQLRIAGESTKSIKASSSFLLLATMLLISIIGLLVGRIINPDFLPIL